jgi:hypothetical protein
MQMGDRGSLFQPDSEFKHAQDGGCDGNWNFDCATISGVNHSAVGSISFRSHWVLTSSQLDILVRRHQYNYLDSERLNPRKFSDVETSCSDPYTVQCKCSMQMLNANAQCN